MTNASCIYSRLALATDLILVLLRVLRVFLIRILPMQVLRFNRMYLECAQGEGDDTLHLCATLLS